MKIRRKRILVQGVVQGVGFRPFVYRLAMRHNLKGFVTNSTRGVEIEAEGGAGTLASFLRELKSKAPVQSRIQCVDAQDVSPRYDAEFVIRPSVSEESPLTPIPPDIATCGNCLRELSDPRDRRYRYPFINCTDCGPRYTIIRGIPYDRRNTTMSVFQMCPECQKEYDDPKDRRFHAQPNACPACGPKVWLADRNGQILSCADPIRLAVNLIRSGGIVAVKGVGGFHLACDATNDGAVRTLRQRKAREEKPLAVMLRDESLLPVLVRFTPVERDQLVSPRRPIVLLPKVRSNPLSQSVAPRNAHFGLLLPPTPLHHLLLGEGVDFLVMTSGNISEEPIAVENDEALKRLGKIADYFLLHDRGILIRNDDSVVRSVHGLPRPIRRSRGFAPEPVFLMKSGSSVLAVGGELKNTVCLTQGDRAFLSQHIGDLENEETLKSFEETIGHLERLYQIRPEIVAYDAHPDYLSTQWALAQKGVERIPVQHHHAHIASCLAENHREDRVIGLALDGTGYGTDGKIWGGEILLADLGGFERIGHLATFQLPGGNRAVREPWRSAAGLLHRVWKNLFHSDPDPLSMLEWIRSLPFVQVIGTDAVGAVFDMINKGINTVETSSLGRLFDAVSALAGVCFRSAYEGQAAMELEMVMENNPMGDPEDYAFSISEASGCLCIETDDVFLDIIQDISMDVPPGRISLKFHRGLVDILAQAASLIRERTDIRTAALSGGCFQNRFLFEHLAKELENSGFEVLTHSIVPANDGGLSLGQAAVALHRLSGSAVDLS